jgi:DNA invertase Pin-like site-specific DNA recombinase
VEAVSYRRVSTEEQGDSRLGLEAQDAAIREEIHHRGWTLAADYSDVASGKTTAGRAGLAAAVDHAKRAGGVLVAAKLDRVSRDVIDFATLLRRAEREGWAVLVMDMPVDTSSPAGRFAAVTMANAAQLERDLISARTREALAAMKRRGVRLGPKTRLTPKPVLRRVARERDAGSTWQSIADGLNRDHVPTVRAGALWRVSTVQRAYQSARLDAEANAAKKAAAAL